MKRLIFILIAGLIAMTSFAQEVQPQLVTVKDTTFKEDARLNYIGNTILPATVKFIEDYNRQAKVAGDSITYKAATRTFLNKIEKAFSDYALNFMEVKNVQVNPADVEKEFNELNKRIESLQKDPDIKYIEAMNEFQRIQKRQIVLAKYYQQINKP